MWVWFSVFVELTGFDQEFLLRSSWAESPFSWVGVTVHDDTLEFGNEAMINGEDLGGRHLGNAQSDSFSFGRNKNALSTDLNSA